MSTNKTKLILPPPTCAPALLNANATEKRLYWDRSHYSKPEAQVLALSKSATVYVGNVAFTTRSIHLKRHFEMLGPVKEVHLGLDRFKKTPCGFSFVEFDHRIDALSAVANLTGTKLDGSIIRVELDAGFKPGRQYGRGTSGGQVRDDRGGSGRKRGRDDRGGGEEQRSPKQRWVPPSNPQQSSADGGAGGGDRGGADASSGAYYGPASTES